MSMRDGNGKPGILVVDDEPDIRAILKELLEGEGYDVSTARNGREGVEKNAEVDPDVVLLDLKMPEMDGLEALHEIRKTDRDAVVCILSAYWTSDMVKDAENLDVYGYLRKPFALENVTGLIKEALAWREGNRKTDGATTAASYKR